MVAWEIFKDEPLYSDDSIVANCGTRLCLRPSHLAKKDLLDFEPRFWKKVEKTDSCWLWRGSRMMRGYGGFGIAGTIWTAHRVSWVIHYGPIPNGKWVLHKCDVRPCVNPDHLFLGDAKDNTVDMLLKGRGGHLSGEQHGRARLTRELVAEIRRMHTNGITGYRLAKVFDIGLSTVYHVINGDTWKSSTRQ